MATARTKHVVLDRGHVEIGGKDYAPGAVIAASVAVPSWLVDQGYLAADEKAKP
jgi:hypothetical protein